MIRDFNVNHISYRFFCDKLVSIDQSNNLIIETSNNNIEFNATRNIEINNNTIFKQGLTMKDRDLSGIKNITAKTLNIDTLFLSDISNSQGNATIVDTNSINGGYIRETCIGYNPDIPNDKGRDSGRSDAYFTFIDISGAGSTRFNDSIYIDKTLYVSGSTTISNDLIVKGTSYVTLYNAINSYITNIKRDLSSVIIMTNDLSATNINISKDLYVNKTSFLNNLTLSGELLNSVLKVPGNFTIDPSGHLNASGTLIINGDLVVYGNKTIIYSNIVKINDITLSVASNLSNILDLSTINAGLDISNIASIKYNGTAWKFSGGHLTVENNKVSLDISLIALKTSSETSLNSLNSYFDLSYRQLKNNLDNSYNATYSRTQIDASFILKSDFDISLLSFNNDLDTSYVNLLTFDASFNYLKSYLDASYILKSTPVKGAYNRIGQIIQGKVIANYQGASTSVSINYEGNIVAIGTDYTNSNGPDTGANVRVYKYNSNSWTLIGDNIDSETTTVYNGNSISLNYNGTILAIGAIDNNAVRAHVRVYRYVNDSSWIKISQTIDCIGNWEIYGFSISLNSSGTIVAIGGPMDNGGVRVFQYIMDGSWTQLGIDFEDARLGRCVSLNADGTIIAVGTPNKNSRGEAIVYRYNDISWIQISQTISGMVYTDPFYGWINDRTGTSVSLNASGDILAVSSPNSSIYGYNSGLVRVYKYVSDGSWIQLGQNNDIVGDVRTNSQNNPIGDNLGYSVSLNYSGNIIAVGAPSNSINSGSSGAIRVYKYNEIGWVRLDFNINILDTYANTFFGTSVALNAEGNRVIVNAPTAPYSIGYSIVYDNVSSGNIIDNSLNFLRTKIDMSYVLKSTFEASYNSLKDQIEISFGTIRLNSLDTSSISINTINTRHSSQRFNNILWNQIGLDISNGPPLTNNNKKVAISNDGKVVALSSSSHSDVSKGRIYVYELSYNQASYSWTRLGLSSEIIVGLSNDDQFGWDIALSSDGRVVAGSSIVSDASGINCGQVRLFELSNNNVWRQKGFNINGPRAGSESGYSISLAGNGNRIAIGSWKDNSNGTNAGAVRVYDFSATIYDWRQQGQTIAGVSGSFEGYATALSLDGQTLASASILEASGTIIGIGGSISTIGGYIIHSFTTTGTSTFRPAFNGSVEVLIVGGGGGGARNLGGGGGGGGVIWIPSVNVSVDTSYTVVVGAGGASETKGNNSSVFDASAAGGGAGGRLYDTGGSGGSGGGAPGAQWVVASGGTSTGNTLGPNSGYIYGYSGGRTTTIRNGAIKGAGGGGAGGIGADTPTSILGDTGQTGAGSGGVGIVNAILGSNYYWAGGGGGGAYIDQSGGWGGLGGGGGGGGNSGGGIGGILAFNNNNGANGGTGNNSSGGGGSGGANTGGGGGGAAYGTGLGGTGGSGIVVIRYLASTIKEHVKTFTWSGTSWINKGIIQAPQIFLLDSSYNGSTTKLGLSIGKSFSYFNTLNNVTYGVDPQNQHISLNGDGTIFGSGIYDQNGGGVIRINRYNTLDNSWSMLGQLIQGNTSFGRNINLSASGYRFSVGAQLGTTEFTIWIYNYNVSTSLWDKIGDISMATVVSSSQINALSGDGNTIAIANEQTTILYNQEGKIRIFRYQGTGTTWTKIGQDICGTVIAPQFGQSIRLSSDGNILAAGTTSYPSPGGGQGIVKVYRFNTNTWTQIGELLGPGYDVNTWKGMGYNRLGISSNGLTIAAGFYGGINIYKYVSDMHWSLTPIYPDPNGIQNHSYPAFLSDDGNTLATRSTYDLIIYKFRQSKWIRIIYFFNDPIYNITLSHYGTTYAFSSRNNALEGGSYVVINKINTTYTGQYYEDLSYNTNKDKYLNLSFGRDVKLSSTGNKIVIGATGPIGFSLDNSANIYNDTFYRYNQGSIWTYEYKGNSIWSQIGQAIQGISGGDEFGSSVSISNDGTIISAGSNNFSSNNGHVRVFAYANNYWNQVSNAIDGKTASSRAGIHALSGDGTTLIQSNNTYNSVYGINKTLAVNAPLTTISGNLIVMGAISVNSLDISRTHIYSNNGYSYKICDLSLSTAIMKEYYSDVTSTRHLKVQITANGNITNRNNSYSSLSDSRLKENIQDSGPKLEDLLKVRVVNYNLKGSDPTKYIGVLAQELEDVFPNLVTELEPSPKDIQDGNTTKYKAVNYSSFDAILIKSLQEQNAILSSIEKRINALENM